MSYIGKVDVGSDRYSVGSTLYGSCDTGASTLAKVVTLDDFTVLIRGVTVYIKFNNGNSAVNNVTLKVGATDPINVVGNCTCNANEILAFTYEENATAPGNCWRTHTCGDVVSHGELETALANIPRAVIFKGVLNNLPDANTSYSTYDNGDIVIVGTKEYIYRRGNSAAAAESYWTEFGDETAYALEANSASITVVNNWTGSSVTNGVLTLPVLTTTTTNVITPRT